MIDGYSEVVEEDQKYQVNYEWDARMQLTGAEIVEVEVRKSGSWSCTDCNAEVVANTPLGMRCAECWVTFVDLARTRDANHKRWSAENAAKVAA